MTKYFTIMFPILVIGFHCDAAATFKNPILDADEGVRGPSIIKHEGFYYMPLYRAGEMDAIQILRSPILSNFRNAERREIYRKPDNYFRINNPKIYSIQGELYIYFSMPPVEDPGASRLFVIKYADPRNPLGDWSAEVRLLPEEDLVAFQATVLQHNNGELFLIWTGYPDPAPPITEHNLFIARLETPMKTIGTRTLLRAPSRDWEKHMYALSEAPFIIKNHFRTLLVFSASGSESLNYCMGIMGIDGGRDPMQPYYWWDDVDGCVFGRNDAENVFGPGHAAFVRSPDDSEMWMVYDAWDDLDNRNLTFRIQKIEWEMNTPMFPPAMGFERELELPSGE